jgi:hypothetical protein
MPAHRHAQGLALLFVLPLLLLQAAVADASPSDWAPVPTPPGVKMKQVAVVNAGLAWGLDLSGTLWNWSAAGWTRKVCCVAEISAAADGTLWATNPVDGLRVLSWSGSAWTSPIKAGMSHVAVLNATTAFGLAPDSGLYRWNGTDWLRLGCCFSQVAVSPSGVTFVTNPSDFLRVVAWKNGAFDTSLPTGMIYLAAGGTALWGIDLQGSAAVLTGNAWSRAGMYFQQLSAAVDGTVWGVNTTGLFRLAAPVAVPH